MNPEETTQTSLVKQIIANSDKNDDAELLSNDEIVERLFCSIHKDKKYVIISGGYIKGVSYARVLSCLINRENDFLTNIKGVAGTSIGTVVALALCCCKDKTSWNRFFEWFCFETRIWDKNDTLHEHSKLTLFYRTLFKKQSLFDNKLLEDFVYELLHFFNLDVNITLRQFYKLTGIEYICNAYCLVKHKTIYFNRKDCPRIRLADAMMASMCLPALFNPIQIQKHYFVDGGIVRNVVENVFPKKETLCIKTEPQSLEPYDPESRKPIWSHLKTVYDILCRQTEEFNDYLNKDIHYNSVTLYLDGFNFMDMLTKYTHKRKLIDKMLEAATKSIEIHVNEKIFFYYVIVAVFFYLYDKYVNIQ